MSVPACARGVSSRSAQEPHVALSAIGAVRNTVTILVGATHEPPYAPSMCIICADLVKGKLTTAEARRALGEMASTLDKTHLAEVERKLADTEAKQRMNKQSP